MTPRIGLTTYLETARFGVWETDAAVLPRTYLNAVSCAGGIPVLLPPTRQGHGELLSAVDALVLTGGADVEPARYGARSHPSVSAQPGRDTFEFALLDFAFARDIPVLGVCRGMQVINIALGGTLIQHLPDQTGTTTHRPAPGRLGTSRITLAPGSLAAAIFGAETSCRCHHHQAVDHLGDGVRPIGWADDGTIEAIHRSANRFVLGVQWHPEEQPDDLRLFTALVDEARTTAGSTRA